MLIWKSVSMEIDTLPKWAGSFRPNRMHPRIANMYLQQTRRKTVTDSHIMKVTAMVMIIMTRTRSHESSGRWNRRAQLISEATGNSFNTHSFDFSTGLTGRSGSAVVLITLSVQRGLHDEHEEHDDVDDRLHALHEPLEDDLEHRHALDERQQPHQPQHSQRADGCAVGSG